MNYSAVHLYVYSKLNEELCNFDYYCGLLRMDYITGWIWITEVVHIQVLRYKVIFIILHHSFCG